MLMSKRRRTVVDFILAIVYPHTLWRGPIIVLIKQQVQGIKRSFILVVDLDDQNPVQSS